jgi:nitrogen regulatory protein PII
LKIDLVCSVESLDKAIEIITQNAKTGQVGDGKIFIYDVLDSIRIRTGECGESAL